MTALRTVLTAASSALVAGALALAPAAAMENGAPVAADDQTAQTVVALPGCTGTAIAEHWVITAQHCVKEGTADIPINLGTNAQSFRTVHGNKAFWAPAGDVALIQVPEGLALKHYATLTEKPIEAGLTGQAYGWGTGTGDTLATAQANTRGSYQFPGTYNNGTMFPADFLNGALPKPGDSGGPLFINNQLAGIVSAGGTNNSPTANYSDVFTQREWVKSHLITTTPPVKPAPTKSSIESFGEMLSSQISAIATLSSSL